MKEQSPKLYRITTRFVDRNRKGVFREEWSRHQTYNVVARDAEEAVNKCQFEIGEILDEIELLNEDIIL